MNIPSHNKNQKYTVSAATLDSKRLTVRPIISFTKSFLIHTARPLCLVKVSVENFSNNCAFVLGSKFGYRRDVKSSKNFYGTDRAGVQQDE